METYHLFCAVDQKAVDESPQLKTCGRVSVLLQFSTPEQRKNFQTTHQPFTNLCGLPVGFMAPAEVAVTSPVPCIMLVTAVQYELGSSVKYCLVPNHIQYSL